MIPELKVLVVGIQLHSYGNRVPGSHGRAGKNPIGALLLEEICSTPP